MQARTPALYSAMNQPDAPAVRLHQRMAQAMARRFGGNGRVQQQQQQPQGMPPALRPEERAAQAERLAAMDLDQRVREAGEW